jgi:hypothetical protein
MYYKQINEPEDYLKFMRYRKTTPPNDIKPKQLRYDNYIENNYNAPKLNLFSPTPHKVNNMQFAAAQINNVPRVEEEKKYVSKYPVELTGIKDRKPEPPIAQPIRNNEWNINDRNFNRERNNNNNYMMYDRNVNNIQNNLINYNVIKADDFIGRSNLRNTQVKYVSPFLYNDKANTNNWEESIRPKRLNFDYTRKKEEIVIIY